MVEESKNKDIYITLRKPKNKFIYVIVGIICIFIFLFRLSLSLVCMPPTIIDYDKGGNVCCNDQNNNLVCDYKDTTKVTQVKTVTHPVETPKITTPEVPKEYFLGDYIYAGDFKWKVTQIQKAEYIGEYFGDTLIGQTADGIYLIIDVEVENIGNSANYLMDTFLKLIDNRGREFSPNSVAAIYLKPAGSSLMFNSINPGIIKKGKIVFDVPKDAIITNLRISSNLLSSSFYSVKLII